jgi:hypothetical protein
MVGKRGMSLVGGRGEVGGGGGGRTVRTILKGKTALQYRKGKLLTIGNERRTFVLISLSQESSEPQALRSSGNHRSGHWKAGTLRPSGNYRSGPGRARTLRPSEYHMVRSWKSRDSQALRTPHAGQGPGEH